MSAVSALFCSTTTTYMYLEIRTLQHEKLPWPHISLNFKNGILLDTPPMITVLKIVSYLIKSRMRQKGQTLLKSLTNMCESNRSICSFMTS